VGSLQRLRYYLPPYPLSSFTYSGSCRLCGLLPAAAGLAGAQHAARFLRFVYCGYRYLSAHRATIYLFPTCALCPLLPQVAAFAHGFLRRSTFAMPLICVACRCTTAFAVRLPLSHRFVRLRLYARLPAVLLIPFCVLARLRAVYLPLLVISSFLLPRFFRGSTLMAFSTVLVLRYGSSLVRLRHFTIRRMHCSLFHTLSRYGSTTNFTGRFTLCCCLRHTRVAVLPSLWFCVRSLFVPFAVHAVGLFTLLRTCRTTVTFRLLVHPHFLPLFSICGCGSLPFTVHYAVTVVHRCHGSHPYSGSSPLHIPGTVEYTWFYVVLTHLFITSLHVYVLLRHHVHDTAHGFTVAYSSFCSRWFPVRSLPHWLLRLLFTTDVTGLRAAVLLPVEAGWFLDGCCIPHYGCVLRVGCACHADLRTIFGPSACALLVTGSTDCWGSPFPLQLDFASTWLRFARRSLAVQVPARIELPVFTTVQPPAYPVAILHSELPVSTSLSMTSSFSHLGQRKDSLSENRSS